MCAFDFLNLCKDTSVATYLGEIIPLLIEYNLLIKLSTDKDCGSLPLVISLVLTPLFNNTTLSIASILSICSLPNIPTKFLLFFCRKSFAPIAFSKNELATFNLATGLSFTVFKVFLA